MVPVKLVKADRLETSHRDNIVLDVLFEHQDRNEAIFDDEQRFEI